jgi:hypothetical protein
MDDRANGRQGGVTAGLGEFVDTGFAVLVANTDLQ